MPLVDPNTFNADTPPSYAGKKSNRAALAQWVMSRVNQWRDNYKNQYEDRDNEVYRLYRGRWVKADKNKESERSRIVSPALSQSIDMTAAEIDESIFGREQWIDLLDDHGDPDHQDINGIRDVILEDLTTDGVDSAISLAVFQGCLYGNLAGKISVESHSEPKIVEEMQTNPETGQPVKVRRVERALRWRVSVTPIPPNELLTDPDADEIDDMLGVAHEFKRPKAWVIKNAGSFGEEGKRAALAYATSRRGSAAPVTESETINRGDPEENQGATPSNAILITDYHGLVPAYLLKPDAAEGERPDMDATLVEARVVILDKNTVVYGAPNTNWMQDRDIVGCAYIKMAGLWRGRSISEMGYNAQKALDAVLRTRLDVFALVANPMLAADATALPRGFDQRIRPGKLWLTNGDPSAALMPLGFQGLDPSVFNETSDLERMVQMGTGAMDTATPLEGNRRNETATGTSLIAGTFVKRTKRAVRHLTRNFVNPLIQRILWRRMQYDVDRYPADLKFRVVSTLGIVAREIENAHLTNLLGFVQQGTQTHRTLTKAIFDSTNSPYKAELEAALEADAQPTPEQQQAFQTEQQVQQAKAGEAMLKTRKIAADIMLIMAQIQSELAKPGVEVEKLRIKYREMEVQLQEVEQYARQNEIAMMNVVASHASTMAKIELDTEKTKAKPKAE